MNLYLRGNVVFHRRSKLLIIRDMVYKCLKCNYPFDQYTSKNVLLNLKFENKTLSVEIQNAVLLPFLRAYSKV